MHKKTSIPSKGIPKEQLLSKMESLRSMDADWRSGKTWSLVYYAGEEHTGFLKKAHNMFFSENGLSPIAFPSLKTFENDVIAMTACMLGGDKNASGTMTSGGTESIMMTMKAYRQWARANRPSVKEPEILLPVTAHPAFEKAAHYFDLKTVHAPVGNDYKADVNAVRELITENTIVMVGSAPAYPHGVIDPIPELAAIAKERSLGFHVDSCLGGFMLPWLEKLGYPVTPFDFSVPGVTSISADIHKYGYAAKGASVVLYRSKELRRHQFFVYSDWPGGIYASPSMTGTRAGGSIAAAWAALNSIGEEGYMRLAESAMKTAKAIMEGISGIKELYILGKPDMSVFAFASDILDIFALGDAMDRRGWHLDRQQFPSSLHMMVTAAHEKVAGPFISDLNESVKEVLANPKSSSEGTAAMYGMAASLPDRNAVNGFVLDFMDDIFK
ncbi:MAG: aspartate aminotransferase family protein [Desulfobacteraceae bacterium]|nr:MAG: aspartate aminotransferase family protein [Desulfobacteraceae bacterium]